MKEYMLSWWYLVQAQLKSYPPWLVQVTFFGITGLIVGFIAKNFGKLIVYTTIGVTVLLWLLHYLQFISIHGFAFKSLLGLSTAHSLDDVLKIYFVWAQTHVIGCVAASVGFFLGWRVG